MNKENSIQYIAFYLPQFHPIPENDKWYGKGFTEWTNVAKARPLYPGHIQPHIPSELGFYDLRLRETRQNQADLAKKYGISAFCYWTYWFGNGEQVLEKPLWDVYNDISINFPFCIAWANHSWEKKMWDKKGNNEVIFEQKYYGVEDYKSFFYNYLPIFKDKRYYRYNGKLFFIIYSPLESKEISLFIRTWRELSQKEGIEDFYFVGKDSACRNIDKILEAGLDAVYDDNVINIHHNLSIIKKSILYFTRNILHFPTIFSYKNAIKYMLTKDSYREDVIPVVCPNWDHSPRSGRNSIILHNSKPSYFYKLLMNVRKIVKNKNNKLVIIKSWNEWGEGNYLEPDLQYGRKYLEAVKKSLEN